MGESAMISVVIPVLNEAASVRELAERIEESMPEGRAYEILFVDDGSTDETAERVKALQGENPHVRLIAFRKNFGKALALETGFRNARGDYILTMDGDLQDDPAEIPRFIEKLEEGFDLVSGWKEERKDPLEKRLPSKLFNRVVSRMSGVPLHDFNCGFKAYRREVIEAIDVYGEMHRYIPCLAARKGFRMAEISVRHAPRRYGKSKYGAERYGRGLLDFCTMWFLMRFEEQPMYLFGRCGLICGALGFGICLYLSALWLMGNAIGHRPLLLLGVLLILTGIQLFSIGLIGEMLVKQHYRRSYDESHIREKR